MARLTLAQIRDTAREITETEADDVSDVLLNLYIRDGYNKIIDLERRWPFLEISFQFNTVQGQKSYPIASLNVPAVREIVSVVDASNVRLQMISLDLAEENFIGPSDVPGRPLYVAFWGGEISLFPTPNNTLPLKTRGYRLPDDWVGSGSIVDGPEEFDLPLVYHAVSRIYQAQEAPGPAGDYERAFNDGIAFARRDIMKPESYAPIRFAGGGRGRMRGTLDF